jgi:hypothetical protein
MREREREREREKRGEEVGKACVFCQTGCIPEPQAKNRRRGGGTLCNIFYGGETGERKKRQRRWQETDVGGGGRETLSKLANVFEGGGEERAAQLYGREAKAAGAHTHTREEGREGEGL